MRRKSRELNLPTTLVSCGCTELSLFTAQSPLSFDPPTPRSCEQTNHWKPNTFSAQSIQPCSNGLAGYEASGTCCPLSCGACDGSRCSQRGGGCCASDIRDSGDKCSVTKSAPCNIDTDTVGETHRDREEREREKSDGDGKLAAVRKRLISKPPRTWCLLLGCPFHAN